MSGFLAVIGAMGAAHRHGGGGSGGGGGGDTSGGWIYGQNTTYMPDATHSGVPSGTSLTTHTGSYTITTAGTTITAQDIHGGIDVKAANFTLSSSRVRQAAASGSAVIDMRWTTCVNATIQDCEPAPDTPSTYLNSIMGHDYTLMRNNIHAGTDGIRSSTNNNGAGNVGTNANVYILANYVHGLAGWNNDPSQGNGPSHCDCWQPEGGNKAVAIGNNFDGRIDGTLGNGSATAANWNGGNHYSAGSLATNTCIQLNHNTAAQTTGVVISQNWMDYAYFNINSSLQGSDHIDSITLNLFGHHATSGKQIWITSGTTVGNKTGNAFADGVGTISTGGF